MNAVDLIPQLRNLEDIRIETKNAITKLVDPIIAIEYPDYSGGSSWKGWKYVAFNKNNEIIVNLRIYDDRGPGESKVVRIKVTNDLLALDPEYQEYLRLKKKYEK